MKMSLQELDNLINTDLDKAYKMLKSLKIEKQVYNKYKNKITNLMFQNVTNSKVNRHDFIGFLVEKDPIIKVFTELKNKLLEEEKLEQEEKQEPNFDINDVDLS